MSTGTYNARKAMHKCVDCGTSVEADASGRYPTRCEDCIFKTKKQRSEQYVKPQSLCWDCENAVPKIRDGQYVQGCDWSISLKPVDGWNAYGRLYSPIASGEIRMTYLVRSCPKFKRTKRRKSLPIDEEI